MCSSQQFQAPSLDKSAHSRCLPLQDKLAPLLLRNAPVACFAINVLTWGRLGYLHEDQAGYGRTAAVFVASWAAQIAMRHALSLAPLPTPWPTLSGDFGKVKERKGKEQTMTCFDTWTKGTLEDRFRALHQAELYFEHVATCAQN